MKRLALIALWLVATAATTVVAYFAVNAADAEVTNRPLSTVVASDATSNTKTAAPSTNSTGVSTTTFTDTEGVHSTTTVPGAPATGPTSSVTTPPTTTLSGLWQQTSITSAGGLVIVSYRPGEVRLESLVPHPGFSYEVKEDGPPEVRVEFQSADLRVDIRAEWDGGPVTDIDEDS